MRFNKNPSFIAGAEWSDENPRKGLVDIDKAIEWFEKNFNMPDDFREHFIKAIEQ